VERITRREGPIEIIYSVKQTGGPGDVLRTTPPRSETDQTAGKQIEKGKPGGGVVSVRKQHHRK